MSATGETALTRWKRTPRRWRGCFGLAGAEAMRAYPVSALVNNPKNDDVRCLQPAA
jgi:putative SOS response-associated peptidase YedK